MKGVFDTRSGSGYDDDIVRSYHFPDRYLGEARKCLGDWIVYREPRRGGGREGYVAVARLSRIEPDPNRPSHSYAKVSGYLPFDAPVPLRGEQGHCEARLGEVSRPSLIGSALQGRSIRTIADPEFAAIVRAGLRETLDPANAARFGLAGTDREADLSAFAGEAFPEQGARLGRTLASRTLRDAAFRRAVLSAYGDRCAVTGIRIVNGGGRAEAQAAHILPVAEGGPDVVQNGLALSATAHWLFDRHLITLTDAYGLLVSHNKVPAELRGLFERQLGLIHLPDDPRLRPHLAYVRRHREMFAAG